MRQSRSTPEIAWPSLSDLSASFATKRRQLDTLGRQVRRLKLRTMKIGRERRVEPEAAVRLLQTRGLPPASARAWVRRAVARRMREVPAVAQKTQTESTIDVAAAYADPLVAAAAQRYDAVHRVTLALPEGRADFSAEKLVRATQGAEQ